MDWFQLWSRRRRHTQPNSVAAAAAVELRGLHCGQTVWQESQFSDFDLETRTVAACLQSLKTGATVPLSALEGCAC